MTDDQQVGVLVAILGPAMFAWLILSRRIREQEVFSVKAAMVGVMIHVGSATIWVLNTFLVSKWFTVLVVGQVLIIWRIVKITVVRERPYKK